MPFHRTVLAAQAAGARFCYYVGADCVRDTNGIVPSAVFEHTPGHAPMLGNGPFARPWYWGHTLEEAQRVCDQQNAARGLSARDVAHILASSLCLVTDGSPA